MRLCWIEKDVILGKVDKTGRRDRQRTKWLDLLNEITGDNILKTERNSKEQNRMVNAHSESPEVSAT